MRTAGEKRKSRAGRKAEIGVARKPCGRKRQPTASEIEAINRKAVVSQRMRQHGLSESAANDEAASTVVGRLYLMGATEGLSQDQYNAALRIAEASHDAGRAILRPTVRSGSDFGGVRGHDGSDGSDASYADWVARVTKRWANIRGAILHCHAPFGMMAVEHVVLGDHAVGSFLGDLRQALNAVHSLHSGQRA